MTAPFPRTLLEFQDQFPDDEACIAYLIARRWPNGFTCPKCDPAGPRDGWRLNARPLWECRRGHQTSITAGTLMENTKLPLRVWFWAAYLMATHSNGFSALQLRQQFGVNYRTAWLLEAKFRRAMIAPDRTQLSGVIEVDQTEVPFRESNPPLGVGGRTGMITVVGAVELLDGTTGDPLKPTRTMYFPDTRPGRIRLAVVPDNTAATLEAFVRENVAPGSGVITDGHRSYSLTPHGYVHAPRTVGPMAAHVLLPWIHRTFALVKRWGMGVYHGLRRRHVQTYLDEFCFRFNRRASRQATFNRILGLAAAHPPVPYHQITGGRPRDYAKDKARRLARAASLGGDI